MYSKIKVAAYCRVSTDMEDQLHSLSAQIKYFTEYISGHEDYELIEVYFDEGITGTSTKKRDGFNRMIADCETEKINLILAKEVSRFARNTIDTLNYTRRLSELKIGVIFMNDGIDTRDKDGELRLTIMSSIAQEESRKISERVKWGMRRRMENGVVLGCGRIYGYKVVDGKLEIVPEEAEIVKEIFHSYLYDGKGSHTIAHELSDRGIPTLKNRVWSPQHVLKILKNEKYVGDLTQWKVYTPNVLAEKAAVNHGDNPEAPLITIRNHHEGIISREIWDSTQAEMLRRSKKSREGRRHSRTYWFSGKMICGKCGYSYTTSSSSKNPHRQAGCRNRQIYGTAPRVAPNGENIGCDNHSIDERVLDKAMQTLLASVQNLRASLEKEMLNEIRLIQKNQKVVDVAPLKAEIEVLKNKKRKAIDLMLEELITKDDLKQQTEFYDGEITKLTEKIAESQNVGALHQKQIDGIKAAMERIKNVAECDVSNTEIYGEMLERIIVPAYRHLNIYLCGIPMGFHLTYTVKKAPCLGIYDVIIDSCEIIS
ncbi:MAG: recombinase family protein [Ruminococcus sp.]|nr:recombinase family protein [Ruminococcus sp.]